MTNISKINLASELFFCQSGLGLLLRRDGPSTKHDTFSTTTSTSSSRMLTRTKNFWIFSRLVYRSYLSFALRIWKGLRVFFVVAMICVHCKQVHEVVGKKVSKHHKKEERCALITKLLLVAFLAAIVIHVDDCGQAFECFYFLLVVHVSEPSERNARSSIIMTLIS